ncbi:1561_t:CDS:2 [Funneliformis geosporum]|uniref:1561_t:CDS:1 n=1 Tax=Funneliformis geosporum TaxID=1117311 RepID=A0A9W4SDC1_9GLOM|nr:1561_t:CDS:2 [Funneliformis geosporum]
MKKELNKKEFSFPPEEEIQKVIKRFLVPNYHRVNIGLKPDASELDKTKYEICQSISRYKRVNKLTPNELKLKISKVKLDHILFGRITEFNLEELVSYTEKLNGCMEVKINYDARALSP